MQNWKIVVNIQLGIYLDPTFAKKWEFGNVVYIVRFMRISQVGGKIRGDAHHHPPIALCNVTAVLEH